MKEKRVKMLRLSRNPNLRIGHHTVLRLFKDMLIVKYSEINRAPHIFSVKFKQIGPNSMEDFNLDHLLDESNLEVNLIEKVDLDVEIPF